MILERYFGTVSALPPSACLKLKQPPLRKPFHGRRCYASAQNYFGHGVAMGQTFNVQFVEISKTKSPGSMNYTKHNCHAQLTQ